MDKAQKERDQGALEINQAVLERDEAPLDRYQASFERDKAVLEKDLLKAELKQTRMVQETTPNLDQLKSEHERQQRKQKELGSGKDRKGKTLIESLMARSRQESKMEVDELTRA